jgi:hypothetical protein
MIPYDDLVAALTSWRARQGLPVSTVGGVPGSGPMPGSGPVMTGSGPVAKSGSGPQRAAPPMAPPKGGYQPPPLASPDTADDSLDVDDEALLEEAQYEGDFAMNFGSPAVEKDEESTTLGHAPERDSFGGETDFDPKTRKPW